MSSRPNRATVPGDSLVNQILHVRFTASVGADEFGFSADGAQFGGQCVAYIIAPAGDDDLCALLGKRESGATADSGQGARDQNDMADVISPLWLCLSGLFEQTDRNSRWLNDI